VFRAVRPEGDGLARYRSVGLLVAFFPAARRRHCAASTRVYSIRVRRCAPEIEFVARGRRGSEACSATQGTDDSVFGVVVLQSVPGVVELRCAGGFGPGRRECIRSASGAVRLIRLLGEGEEGRIRMALVANSGQWTDQDNRLKAAIRGLARKPGETGFGWRLAPARQLGQRPGSPTSTSSGSRTCTNLSPAEPSRVTSTSRS
jgi:hypothetical protein